MEQSISRKDIATDFRESLSVDAVADAAQIAKELDFSQPNGGVNFTPTEYEIIANRGGDPRWLPNTDEEEE